MEEKRKMIQVIDEQGIERNAELLAILEISTTGNKYCIYSIENNNDSVSILASAIEKDGNFETLKEITNADDKREIYNLIIKLAKELGFYN